MHPHQNPEAAYFQGGLALEEGEACKIYVHAPHHSLAPADLPKLPPYATLLMIKPGLCIEGPVGLHVQKRMHLAPGGERPALQKRSDRTLSRHSPKAACCGTWALR